MAPHRVNSQQRRTSVALGRPSRQGSNRDFQTNGAPGFSSSSSKLLTKSALHLGQGLLARDLVTSTISCTRTRHRLLDSLSRLRRYFAQRLLSCFEERKARLRPLHLMSELGSEFDYSATSARCSPWSLCGKSDISGHPRSGHNPTLARLF